LALYVSVLVVNESRGNIIDLVMILLVFVGYFVVGGIIAKLFGKKIN